MIWSVSTLTRSIGATMPVKFLNGCISAPAFPFANVNEMAFQRGRGGHHGTHQMGAAAGALPALEIAIRRAGASLAGLQDVRIHPQAHAAAALAPFEASVGEDTIE